MKEDGLIIRFENRGVPIESYPFEALIDGKKVKVPLGEFIRKKGNGWLVKDPETHESYQVDLGHIKAGSMGSSPRTYAGVDQPIEGLTNEGAYRQIWNETLKKALDERVIDWLQMTKGGQTAEKIEHRGAVGGSATLELTEDFKLKVGYRLPATLSLRPAPQSRLKAFLACGGVWSEFSLDLLTKTDLMDQDLPWDVGAVKKSKRNAKRWADGLNLFIKSLEKEKQAIREVHDEIGEIAGKHRLESHSSFFSVISKALASKNESIKYLEAQQNAKLIAIEAKMRPITLLKGEDWFAKFRNWLEKVTNKSKGGVIVLNVDEEGEYHEEGEEKGQIKKIREEAALWQSRHLKKEVVD